MSDLREKVARAMDDADHGWSVRLASLVDGVSTYTADMKDGTNPVEFDDYDDAMEYVTKRRDDARADAAIAVCMEEAADRARVYGFEHGMGHEHDSEGAIIEETAFYIAAALRALRGEGGTVDSGDNGGEDRT